MRPKQEKAPATSATTTIEAVLPEQNEEVRAAFDLPEEPRIIHIARRRTEDEMRRALRLLVSGERRPRDDESPQILEDAIGEVFMLRQILMDIMGSASTLYQDALASIRKMTEK